MLNLVYDFISNSYNIYTIGLLLIMLLIAGYIDYHTYKIPNKLNLSIVILRVLMIPVIGMISLQNIGACLLAFFFFLIPAMALNHKMGGDIKCVTSVALFFDIYTTLLFLFVSCILSFGVHFYLRKRFNTKLVPFAPFFCLSHVILSGIYLLFTYNKLITIGFGLIVLVILLIIILIDKHKLKKQIIEEIE